MRGIQVWLLHAAVIALGVVATIVLLAIVQYALAFEFAPWINFALTGLIVGAITSELPSNRRGKQPLPIPTTA